MAPDGACLEGICHRGFLERLVHVAGLWGGGVLMAWTLLFHRGIARA